MMLLPLSEVSSGSKVKIKDFSSLPCRSVLLGIGILPEDEIEVIRSSFLGSPIFFRNQKGLFFALRRPEAEKIEVQVEGL